MLGTFRVAGLAEYTRRPWIGFGVGLRAQSVIFKPEPSICASLKSCWLYFNEGYVGEIR